MSALSNLCLVGWLGYYYSLFTFKVLSNHYENSTLQYRFSHLIYKTHKVNKDLFKVAPNSKINKH